jgi:predicted component of type VI protein secretion system
MSSALGPLKERQIMQVSLKVVAGAKVGRLVPIAGAEFRIGRGEGCHLRPKSDSISRHHCTIRVNGSDISIEDNKSRNGTIVNGEKTEGAVSLKMGDKVQVGPLEFELEIDYTLGGKKQPAVSGVQEAAKRASTRSSGMEDDDVSNWLEEADEQDRVVRMADPATRQFNYKAESEKDGEGEEQLTKRQQKIKDLRELQNSEPGKLPTVEGNGTDDSQDAAAKTLRKMFNRNG